MVIPAYFRLNLGYNAKLMYGARRVQMNLPPSISWNSCARVGGYEVWQKSAIGCNCYFGKKLGTHFIKNMELIKVLMRWMRSFAIVFL